MTKYILNFLVFHVKTSSFKRLGEKNGFYGKKWKECFSEDQLKAYCEKRSANMLGSKNHMY